MSQAERLYRITSPMQPEKLEKKAGDSVLATELQAGDWSVDHDALIARTVSVDQGRKIEIQFFENRHVPVKIDRDDTLNVIRGI